MNLIPADVGPMGAKWADRKLLMEYSVPDYGIPLVEWEMKADDVSTVGQS